MKFGRCFLSWILICALLSFPVTSDVRAESRGVKKTHADPWQNVVKEVSGVSLVALGGYVFFDAFRLQARKVGVESAVKHFLTQSSDFGKEKAFYQLRTLLEKQAEKKPISVLSRAGREFLKQAGEKIAEEGLEKAATMEVPAASKLVVKNWVFDVMSLGGGALIMTGSGLALAAAVAVADITSDASSSTSMGSTLPALDVPKEYFPADCPAMRTELTWFHNFLEVKGSKNLVAVYNSPSLNLEPPSDLYQEPTVERAVARLLYFPVKHDINTLLEKQHGVPRPREKAALRAEFAAWETSEDAASYGDLARRICKNFADLQAELLASRTPQS